MVELDLQRFYNLNRRILMWIVFFGILYLLRDFFAVMFLAFIFGFVMRKVAKFLVATTRAPYKLAVIIPYLVALTLLVLLMMTMIPKVIKEGNQFKDKAPKLLDTLAGEIKKASVRLHMESVLIKYVAPEKATEEDSEGLTTLQVLDSITSQVMFHRMYESITHLVPSETGDDRPFAFPQVLVKFVIGVAAGAIKFLLAILLSFLIVLDFDHILSELYSWRNSPVGKFFHEAAASVVEFSEVVGTAFQCQMVVALLNATITCVGLTILRIQPVLLLTTIVFLLGLVPVLGVWISSVPIVLIAFNDHGLGRALAAIGLITGVHLLEAYVFNPRIYAARFHLNPVIVLIILLVGEKLFGVWGMLLGIPVTHYVLNIAQVQPIMKKPRGPRANAVISP